MRAIISLLIKILRKNVCYLYEFTRSLYRDEKILGGLTYGKNGPHEKFWEVPVARIVRAPENELFLTNFITDPIQRPHR